MRQACTAALGGAGFIDLATVKQLTNETDTTFINIDALTYAGGLWKKPASSILPTYSWRIGEERVLMEVVIKPCD